MKKKKTIILKNPRLQKVRSNLRTIFIKWAQEQWFQLNKEKKVIDRDAYGKPRKIGDFSSEENEKFDKIRARVREIDQIVNHSIYKCTVCSASDKDMTYNPEQKRWFCVDCYQQ